MMATKAAVPACTLTRKVSTLRARLRVCVRFWLRCSSLRRPSEMRGPEIEAFLSSLAVKRNVAASTQKQALAAILFLYSWDLPD